MSGDLIIIGLDGARYDVLEEWISQGELPTLGGLVERGFGTTLESVLPGPHSGPAWTSFSTGCSPDKHGIPSARLLSGYSRHPATNDDTKVKRYWELLSEHGLTSGVFNVPLTWPPSEIDGVQVTSWATPPFETFATPREFQAKLEAMEYEINGQFSSPEDSITDLKRVVEKRAEAAGLFMGEYDWDHLMLTFYATELAHHQLSPFIDPNHPRYDPSYEERTLDVYKEVDAAIGRLLKKVNDPNVFVISDHGFAPICERIYVNKILERQGWLTPADTTATQDSADDNLSTRVVQTANRTANRLNVKRYIRSVLQQPGLRRIGSKLTKIHGSAHAHASEKTFDIDWTETVAFAGYETGCIFINQESVFEDGIVSPEQYDAVVDDIVDSLLEDSVLRERIVTIHRGDELFDAEITHEQGEIPDIVIETKDEYRCSTGIPDGDTYLKSHDEISMVGHHTKEGVLLGAGPVVARQFDGSATLLDLAPTILHALGTPIPERIDGDVLWDMFRPDSEIAMRAPEYSADDTAPDRKGSVTDEEREKIANRLENLGYKS